MIPISVSDIIKLLDQIPIWKAVKELPKRVTELENKVKALEGAAPNRPTIPNGKVCPMCGDEMRVIKEQPHPTFAFAGTKVHEMKCPTCQNEVQRDFNPGKGYE